MSWLPELIDNENFQLVVLPLLIFLARVTDVSLGTLRTVFVGQGVKIWAAVLGFFEVLIWLLVISYILRNLNSPVHYLAYAGGYATGNYVGLLIEEKLARGLLSVMIITNRDARGLLERLQSARFGITSLTATGISGRVRLILSVVRRRDLEQLRRLVEELHPNSFIVIQPVKSVSRVYPLPENRRFFAPLFGRKER